MAEIISFSVRSRAGDSEALAKAHVLAVRSTSEPGPRREAPWAEGRPYGASPTISDHVTSRRDRAFLLQHLPDLNPQQRWDVCKLSDGTLGDPRSLLSHVAAASPAALARMREHTTMLLALNASGAHGRTAERDGRRSATAARAYDRETSVMTVLLVEDDAGVRECLSAILDEAGLDVLAATSAEAALSVLDRVSSLAALVTDLHLGAGMDGVALIEAARRRCPGLGAVLISGADTVGLEPGPNTMLLAKPFRGTALLRAVRDITAGQSGPARCG